MFLSKQQCLSAIKSNDIRNPTLLPFWQKAIHLSLQALQMLQVCAPRGHTFIPLVIFVLESDKIIAGNTFSKAWKEKFTVIYRQLLRKFRAFSNQNRRILHVPDKSVIPLRSWREQHDLCSVLAVNRLILINRDLMLPTSSLFFITRPEDRQVLREELEEGWFGQPQYSTNVCVNSRFYRFRLKK